MVISVTEHDIKMGYPGWPGMCPIALAAKRAFKTDYLTVMSGSIYVEAGYPGAPGEYKLPDEAVYFIGKFDSGLVVEPFTFEFPGLT